MEECLEMLMDQRLDLTLTATMLPMLVELHVGIYFKCNIHLLYFVGNSSSSIFFFLPLSVPTAIIVLLNVVLFLFIFVLFNPFILLFCVPFLGPLQLSLSDYLLCFCLDSHHLTFIVFLFSFFHFLLFIILPLNSSCSHPVNYGVMFDYMFPFESNNTILLKHSNSIFMLCTKH